MTALLIITACSGRPDSSWLMLGGDVMLSRGGEPFFLAISPWGEVSQYLSENKTDLYAINLESPFGVLDPLPDPAHLDMNLCATGDTVSILQQAGVDLVTTANNHSEDCKAAGTIDTKDSVEKAGIQALDDSQGVRLVPVGVQTVAFTNINAYPGTYDPGALAVGLAEARQQSDLVVVSIHWGNEYQAGPSQAQEQLAQNLVDAGADLVWGHHPHVLQRMEWKTSAVDGHQALIMYSLGNLLSDQWMLPDALRSALIRIEFSNHQVKAIAILPIQMDAQGKILVYAKDVELQEIVDRLNVDELQEGATTTEIRVEGID